MTNAVLRLSVFLAGVVLGLCIAVGLLAYEQMTFEASITAGNVIQGCATILTGLIVASYIQWHTQADRKEKDILLSRLDVVLSLLDELEPYKEGGSYTDVTAALKRLAVAARRYCELAKFANYPKDVANTGEFIAKIKPLRKLMTDTPTKDIKKEARQSGMSNVVTDGIIRMANEKKMTIERALQELVDLTLRTQVQLNRARRN